MSALEKAAKKFDKRWAPLLAAGAGAASLGATSPGATSAAPGARLVSPAAAELCARSLLADAAPLVALSARVAELTESLPPPVRAGGGGGTARPSLGVGGAPLAEASAPLVKSLDILSLPVDAISYVRVRMAKGPLDEPIAVPVLVARGAHAGPVLGITSTLHGNELAGIPVIHRLFAELDTSTLCGTVVAVPVVNPIGFLRYTRGFSDGADLNRIMPGKKGGSASQSFAFALMTRLIAHVDFLLDLHTASFGRVNSVYVRADMNEPHAHRLALLQAPQIIVHNTGPDGSMRGACAALGKPAITIEIGDPQVIDAARTEKALQGIRNTLAHLKMSRAFDVALDDSLPVVCSRSFWMFSKAGGILTVKPAVTAWVRKGEVIAEIHSIWGALIDTVPSPADGIVVGKSTNPVCQSGDRILHIGVVEDSFSSVADDGH